MRIGDGEMISILGEPGAGKSLLLRMVAGLEQHSSGTIRIGATDVTNRPANQRGVLRVGSGDTLVARPTVRATIESSLQMDGTEKDSGGDPAEYAARLFGIADLLRAKPVQLSPPQRQRVALAQAFASSPSLLLLDDPFLTLSYREREDLCTTIRAAQRKLRTTTLVTTDDYIEAMTLGDRLAVLDQGRLAQVDTPAHIYDRPVSTTVARLVGSPPINLIEAVYRDGNLRIGEQELEAPPAWQMLPTEESDILLGLRPESFEIGGAPKNRVIAVLDPTTRAVLGSRTVVHGYIGSTPISVEFPGAMPDLPRRAFAPLEVAHIFEEKSGHRLSM
jgi:ABC-type sugar transport system ATPase subunit